MKQLLTKSGSVCGVTYEKKGKDFTEEGAAVRGYVGVEEENARRVDGWFLGKRGEKKDKT